MNKTETREIVNPQRIHTMITAQQLKRREQLIALAFLALMLSPFFIL